jgi:hypothetical protein
MSRSVSLKPTDAINFFCRSISENCGTQEGVTAHLVNMIAAKSGLPATTLQPVVAALVADLWSSGWRVMNVPEVMSHVVNDSMPANGVSMVAIDSVNKQLFDAVVTSHQNGGK